MIIEWDLFYPLPTTWHQPEVTIRPRTTKAITTTTPLAILPVESMTPPMEIWQPNSGWTNDVIQEINENNLEASKRRVRKSQNSQQTRYFSISFRLEKMQLRVRIIYLT